MALFSQRKGLRPLQKSLQTNGLDQETRNGLWSVITITILDHWSPSSLYASRATGDHAVSVENLYRAIWLNIFKEPIDMIPSFNPKHSENIYDVLRGEILTGEWFSALDLIEFIAKQVPIKWKGDVIKYCNLIFTQENTAYRFIDTEITEITDEAEIESITEALESPKEIINEHFQKALTLLSDRKSPDYRNSIKESISAVESLCKIISGKRNGSLGECLKIIQQSHPMHKAFQTALTSLYGYTSDEGGIRHALTEESLQPTFADAKFMLVSCTAFVNYLLTIAAEENISLSGQ